ncbi:mechanosensitive ion channel [Candidatus Thorarchaeota archaeon]|nr:MAG: mechanosensitive ion channel [Candidatus Thorarchaeota archaeon]
MQTIDFFQSFVDYIRSLLSPYGFGSYAIWIAILPFLLIVYIVYLVVVRSIKISARRVGMPREAMTGMIFIVRLLFFAIALLAVLATTNVVLGEAAIAISTLLGSAIGLASSRALGNLVSGLYVFAARPFRVGDYVKIGDVEGIVLEITLNYTKIMQPDYNRAFVPNGKVVDSGVTNYRVRIDDYLLERGEEYHQEPLSKSRLNATIDRLKYLTMGDEIYRYSFDVYVHMSYDIDRVKEIFDRICREWEDRFIHPPEHFYYSNENFGVIYRFAIIVKEPRMLLTTGAEFQTEIAEGLQRLKTS